MKPKKPKWKQYKTSINVSPSLFRAPVYWPRHHNRFINWWLDLIYGKQYTTMENILKWKEAQAASALDDMITRTLREGLK